MIAALVHTIGHDPDARVRTRAASVLSDALLKVNDRSVHHLLFEPAIMNHSWSKEALRILLGFLFLLACIEAGEFAIYLLSPRQRILRVGLRILSFLPIVLLVEYLEHGQITRQFLGRVSKMIVVIIVVDTIRHEIDL